MFWAAPESALPTKKRPTEASMTGRRPKASARRPERGRLAALARPYAEPTQTNLSPPLRESVMVGRAIEIAVRSSALTNEQTKMAMKVSQKAEPLRKPDGGLAVTSESTVEVGFSVVLGGGFEDIGASSV